MTDTDDTVEPGWLKLYNRAGELAFSLKDGRLYMDSYGIGPFIAVPFSANEKLKTDPVEQYDSVNKTVTFTFCSTTDPTQLREQVHQFTDKEYEELLVTMTLAKLEQ